MSAERETPRAWEVHPWVRSGQDAIRFGIMGGLPTDWVGSAARVQLIEDLGFDSFWVGDHPLFFSFDCWTLLATLAVMTKRIRLGPLVDCIYYRHPVVLARMATDVDRLSDGRLVLGLGIGDYAPEFEQMALPLPAVAERQQALEEAIQIVQGVLGETPFTYQGKAFQVKNAILPGASLPKRRFPILIAGGGERTTLRQVAQYADACNFGASGLVGHAWDLVDVRRKLDALASHCHVLGRPSDTVLRSHLTYLLLADADAAVRVRLDALATRQEITISPKIDGLPYDVRTYYNVPAPKPIPMAIVAGTPQEVRAYYQSLIDVGMQYFIVNLVNGDDATVRVLAEQVMHPLGSSHSA